MKVRKAVKKIVALATGATMMGATLLGATAAADLADYPGMFIDNGKFDGYLVVGDNAISMDVVGVTNVAASLQAESVKTTYVSVGTAAESSVDDGIKIDKSSEHLWLTFDLDDVQDTALDDTDLPDMLADGTYDESEGETDNDEDYTQEISFTAGTGTVVFDQDDTDAPEAGWYLMFDDGSGMFMYTYLLEFDNPIEYENSSSSEFQDDWEGTELEMQGQIYTIIDVDGSGNAIDKMELMAGETVLWLQQDEVVTRIVDGTEHEIEMVDVTEGQDSCGFKVDGSTVWVDVDESETKNGVTIGVLDAKAVYTEARDADICKVNIGASQLILEDGQEIKMNGKDIDGSNVVYARDADTYLESITITYVPDDDVYLGPGDELQDPVFGNFKFVIGSVVQKTEAMTASSSGDDGEFVFISSDGKEVTIPVYSPDEIHTVFGDGDGIDDRLYLEGEQCLSGGDVRDCEGAMFYAVTTGGEPHVVEIRDIDTGDLQVDFRDLTYDADDNDNDYTVGGAGTVFGLGSGLGSVTLNITAANVTFNEIDGSAAGAETKYEGLVTLAYLNSANRNATVNVAEKDDEANVDGGDFDFDFLYDVTDEEVQIKGITANNIVGGFHANGVDASDDNNDDVWYVTDWGTTLYYDSEDKRSLDITYPEEPAWLEVFFTPISAQVLEGGAEGEVATQTVQKIAVGAVKLASEVSNIKAVNAVVVGGPCANTAAAALMGNPANCAEGFEEGHAKIKLFENNGKVQLLVAGYAAADTRRAAVVLADYSKYTDDLAGDEVDVTGTSLSDISVGEPMMEAEEETTE
jgi:hypothetical protein